ncbi:extracellular solute-binding protein [Paenibacillus sp. PAMC21692]|uniref:ABC transporter substrate-binding protein n=1 Tax=Paenibacillus sp. PAMC21692 TaxID=2762320 RepID=UPI00164EB38B|nr:extracellular solute-binding protein [Paenibacillus sp. PAMC21692]QNK57409.1 extracellular solute-binding protein [Paenibacillus sp. PAMC21692]
MKRFLSTALVLLITLVALAGCTGNSEGEGKTSEPPGQTGDNNGAGGDNKLEQVTLKIMIPGDRPPDMDLVIAEAEKRMKDTINVKLDVVFVPWSDLAQKTQVTLASGENIDLIFDAPWLHINQMIASGFYEPLDDLLAEYGKTVLEKRPQQMWDYNKYGGKIMAVPLGVSYMSGNSYMVRKDIREKLGVPPIKTYEDLIAFAYKVKEQEKGIIPMTAGSATYSFVAHHALNDYETHVRPTHALGNSLMLYYKYNDGKVYNLLEDREPIGTWLANTYKWFTDGLIFKDILTTKDFHQPISAGKVAIVTNGAFGIGDSLKNTFKNNVPNGELETVTFFSPEKGANFTNFKQWNFLAVPKVSKNKERAIMFLNWANEKENYDLLSYGIEGKHWEAVGEDKMKNLDTSGYSAFGYVWLWNPVDERTVIGGDPKNDEMDALLRDADMFTTDILAGFEFDGTSVQNEISQYNTVDGQYYTALFNGVIDPEDTLKKFEAEAGPALKKIQQELQKQIDEFLAARGK